MLNSINIDEYNVAKELAEKNDNIRRNRTLKTFGDKLNRKLWRGHSGRIELTYNFLDERKCARVKSISKEDYMIYFKERFPKIEIIEVMYFDRTGLFVWVG